MDTAHELWESAECHLLYAVECLIIYSGSGFFIQPALHYILWCDETRSFG
jgi:hypothetical protein